MIGDKPQFLKVLIIVKKGVVPNKIRVIVIIAINLAVINNNACNPSNLIEIIEYCQIIFVPEKNGNNPTIPNMIKPGYCRRLIKKDRGNFAIKYKIPVMIKIKGINTIFLTLAKAKINIIKPMILYAGCQRCNIEFK